VLATLPNPGYLAQAFLAYDLVGLQTEGDRERLCEFVCARPAHRNSAVRCAAPAAPRSRAPSRSASTRRRCAGSRRGEGEREFQRQRAAMRGRKLIIGVDRLDYTKGLLRRLRAFELFSRRSATRAGASSSCRSRRSAARK